MKIGDLDVPFRLGFEEANGDVGVTYDNDAESPRSVAYDVGRSLGELTLPMPWRMLLLNAPRMHLALRTALVSMMRLAEAAGDVEEWNAGGHAHEACNAIRQVMADIVKGLEDVPQPDEPAAPPIHTTEFVLGSDVFRDLPAARDAFIENSDSDFTWGGNNRSLVTAESFRNELKKLDDCEQGELATAIERLTALGQTYVDLEN